MKELGEQLRQKREAKGISLKEVENALNIRVKYLNAIEQGNFDLIPGEVYLKGFIRNYANFLGLSGEDLVNQYKAKVEEAIRIQQAAREEVPPPQTKPAFTFSGKTVLIAAVVAVVLTGSIVFYSLGVFGGKDQPQQQPKPTTTADTPAAPPVKPAPASPPPAPSAAETQNVKLTVKYTQWCWTRITADGQQIFEGHVGPGETYTWEAKDRLEVIFGNAGGVALTLNGQYIGSLGRSGVAVNRVFTKP